MRAAVAALLITLPAVACAPQPTTAPMAGSTGAAPSAAAGQRQCFNAGNVSGFRVVDDRTVDLDVGANQSYRAQLFGTCPDVRGALGVGLRTRGGSSFVCDDQDLELVVPSESRNEVRTCQVTALRRLTEAEVAARKQRR